MSTSKKLFYEYALSEKTKTSGALNVLLERKDILGVPENKRLFFDDIRGLLDIILNYDNSVDGSEINYNLVNFLDIEAVDDYLKDQNTETSDSFFDSIASVAGATSTTPGLTMYSPLEMKKIIDGFDKNYESGRFFHTLRQAMMGVDTHQYAVSLLPVLRNEQDNNASSQTDWKSALTLTMSLYIFWIDYLFLDEEYKKILLQKYFYRSIICGISVQKYLAIFLKKALDVIDFVTKDKFLVDTLRENKEKYLQNGKVGVATVSALVEEYKKMFPKDVLNLQKMDEFLANKFKSKTISKEIVSRTKEAIDAYVRLEKAKLTSFYSTEELTDAEAYYSDLLQLIRWFFQEDGWSKIVIYFEAETPLVPFENFIEKFVLYYNLKDEKNIERIINFWDLVKKEGFIPQDYDLLQFQESDGSFHWNSETKIASVEISK